MIAILMALNWVEEIQPSMTVICSDSYSQGLKQKKNLSLNFLPGGGLVAGVDTFAGIFNKKKLTKALTTEIVLFKRNNGKLNTRK